MRQGSFAGLPWFDEARVLRATDPVRTLPGARSVVLLAASYRNPAPPRGDRALRGRVARYAWGRDYHRVLEKRARPLVGLLAEHVPLNRVMSTLSPALIPALASALAPTSSLMWTSSVILTFGTVFTCDGCFTTTTASAATGSIRLASLF